MYRFFPYKATATVLTFVLSCVSTCHAAIPADQLVPSSAKGFISIPDVKTLEANWNNTFFSQLFTEESIKPFVEDLETQMDRRFETTGIRTGMSLADLREVCTGEASIAFLQPDDEAQKHAIVAIADTTGNNDKVQTLLAKIDKNMMQRQATKRQGRIEKVPATIYTVPIKKGAKKTFEAIIMYHDGMLVATDHGQIAKQLASNINDPGKDCIGSLSAFRVVMKRCANESDGLEPDVRWFAEPLGYAMVAREFSLKKKKRRTDILKAMKAQGFDAIKGIGGHVNFAAEGYEILQRAYAYAPPVKAAGDQKYENAAALMAYPAQGDLDAQDWISSEAGTYMSARWDIRGAYKHVGKLVDEVAGEEGFFEDLIESLRADPNGPKIDLKKEIIAHLGDRATVITQAKKPIGTSSERFLVAIDLVDAKAMSKSLRKMLQNDPEAQPIDYRDHVIWEILNEGDDLAVVEVEGIGEFDDMNDFDDDFGDDEEADPLLSNAAISVTRGCLVISSHVDFVKEVIDFDLGNKMRNDADYAQIRQALQAIGDDDETTNGRLIARADREVEVSYELLRSGEMPKSEGLIGRLLNRVLATDDTEVREQEINGENLPEFNVVSKYLGPLGLYIRTEQDGWYTGGVALKKDDNLQEARQSITTAAADESTIE